jgi:hypothetical protein
VRNTLAAFYPPPRAIIQTLKQSSVPCGMVAQCPSSTAMAFRLFATDQMTEVRFSQLFRPAQAPCDDTELEPAWLAGLLSRTDYQRPGGVGRYAMIPEKRSCAASVPLVTCLAPSFPVGALTGNALSENVLLTICVSIPLSQPGDRRGASGFKTAVPL